MQASFFSDIILHKPELFRAMLLFNGLIPSERQTSGSEGGAVIARDMEEESSEGSRDPEASYREQSQAKKEEASFPEWKLPGLDISLLMNSRRFRRHFFSDSLPGYWDFGEESRRIALLPAEKVEQLALTFGACIHSVELTRIILREQVIAISAELGAESYLYAIKRGRFQLGTIRQFFLARDAQESLPEKIRRHGREAISWSLEGWPEELRMRCPHIPRVGEYPENLTPALRRALWFGLKKLLVKEVAPQWAPCFD